MCRRLKKKFKAMNRLNTGHFRIFELSLGNSNLNSSHCGASKIIWNETKLEAIPWELDVENPLFNFCVGVWIGGHPPAKLFRESFFALTVPSVYIKRCAIELPTHISATHAVSKIYQKFQNRIPRELDENFDIPRINVVYWFISNFWKLKMAHRKKSYGDST